MNKKAVDIIRSAIERRGLNISRIILFGSRARGDFKQDSDWDFIIVLDEELEPTERRRVSGEIYRELAGLDEPCEIIIKSASDFDRFKHIIGTVSFDAHNQGKIAWMR